MKTLAILLLLALPAAALNVSWTASCGGIATSGRYTAPTVTVQTRCNIVVTDVVKNTAQTTAIVDPLAHSVDLAWGASLSINVISYNVYRSPTPGGPYSKIANVPGLVHTDSNVASGTSYYYVVTAVDNMNNESTYSNEALAVIPLP